MRVQTLAFASWLIAAAIAGSYAMNHSLFTTQSAARQSQTNDIAHRGSGRITTDNTVVASTL
jgi:hypothetical protein